jgi:hypothetical protein
VSPLLAYLVLFLTGLVAGTVNVVAGGGSLLTLPVMIFLGLPATVANGTNRVAILAQNLVAVGRFRREGFFETGWLKLAGPPALAGALLGAWLAVRIGDATFETILALVMVAVAAGSLARRPGSGGREDVAGPPPGLRSRAVLALAFFGVGFYGGFIQAGLGFLLLALTTAAGLDLVRGNALKVLLALLFTPFVLLLFSAGGKVDWGMGAALAAGNALGAVMGVRVTVARGHEWVRRAVVVLAVVFAVGLLLR